MKEKGCRLIGITVLSVILACCGLLAFGFFSFPPTEWITRNYFDAIIAGDLEKAMQFTSESVRVPGCKEATKEDAQDDIATFGGSEIRNVAIQVVGSGGSDETIQVGRVRFEYRKPPDADWHEGYTQILTTFDDFGLRYTCGKYP